MQGSLSLADVEASWSGKIVFKNIVWLDPAGKTIAEIPRVIVSFDLIDGFKGNLGVNSIKDIKVEQAIFDLAYTHKKGLSIVQLINLDNLKKNSLTKKTAVEHEPFIGIFRVENSNLNFLFENKQFAFSDLNFKADLTANPNILVAMHVKEQDTKIDLALTSTPEKTSITGTAKNLLAIDIMSVLPAIGNIKITSGKIPTSTFVAEKEQQGWQLKLHGNVENLAGTALDYKLDSINGDFYVTNQALELKKFTLNLENQAATLEGKITIQPSPKYDLNITAPNFIVNALSPGLNISEPLALSAKITGELAQPNINGNFAMNTLVIEPLALNNIEGNFNYFNTLLTVTNMHAQALSGNIAANGTVELLSKTFNFNVSGQQLDSTQATGTQIHGPLQFSLVATGSGEPSSANATGDFTIDEGDFAGIPFQSLQGNFNRANGKMTFSNIIIHTFAGTFNSSAIQDANGKIKFEKLNLAFQKNNFSEQKETLKSNLKINLKDKLKSIF